MANLKFIHEKEDAIFVARKAVADAKAAWDYELEFMEGKPREENRDSWGTLWCNAQAFKSELQKLLDAMTNEFGAF